MSKRKVNPADMRRWYEEEWTQEQRDAWQRLGALFHRLWLEGKLRKRTSGEVQGTVSQQRAECQKQVGTSKAKQGGLKPGDVGTTLSAVTTKTKIPWPKTLPEQVQAVRAALTGAAGPVTAEVLARTFLRARTVNVAKLLATLAAIGQAREVEPGTYTT